MGRDSARAGSECGATQLRCLMDTTHLTRRSRQVSGSIAWTVDTISSSRPVVADSSSQTKDGPMSLFSQTKDGPMSRTTIQILGLVLSLFGCSGETKDCALGSASCECTGGGACDEGLSCLSGICVNDDLDGPGGSGGASGGSGGVSGDNGDGSGDNGDGSGGNDSREPMTECPAPGALAKASIDFGDNQPPPELTISMELSFDANGVLSTADGSACEVREAPENLDGADCVQAYQCDGCDFLFSHSSGFDRYGLEGEEAAACAQYDGLYSLYSLCFPSCEGKTCGDNGCGGVCGTCAGTQVCKAGGCSTSTTSDCDPECAALCSGVVVCVEACGCG